MGLPLNNVNCDIFIGRGAGKKLIDDITNARYEIKIISPYLTPDLIALLIELYHKNISIKLITTKEIEDFYHNDKNIHKLIKQIRTTDNNAIRTRNKLLRCTKILSFSFILLLFVLLFCLFFLKDYKYAIGLVPLAMIYFIRSIFYKKHTSTRVFNYSYQQLFPFKVFYTSNQDSENFTIHSKIYIIDNKIAYLGSLNFTKSGLKNNYETRIRLTDSAPVLKISNEFDSLFESPDLRERDIQIWGQQIYSEPIN